MPDFQTFLAGYPPVLGSQFEDNANPFLAGNKLPVAAKKGVLPF